MNTETTPRREAFRAHLSFARLASALVTTLVVTLAPTRADAVGPCTATARTVFGACQNEIKDDFFIAQAICINESDAAERARCVEDAKSERVESNQLCAEQRSLRLEACAVLGQGRYDPDLNPALFENNFANLTNPNPYFPLRIGDRWEYREGTKSVTVEVLNQTKLIEGVRCIVVRARDVEDGKLVEDTPDWYCQAKDGDVWYFGEEVKDFESFAGDRPMKPELVSCDGSFKAGRHGAKPGIIFRRFPTAGEVYRQEYALGNAEDINQVLSTSYAYGNAPELDRLVPRRLAQLFCASDCVVVKDYTPLEPGDFARKYYAPEVGLFLEVKLNARESVPLVGCNFDPRCRMLSAR
ncbi:MAG: hypothetical protein ACR2KU_11980 [Gammaproteobacteria bacterium]